MRKLTDDSGGNGNEFDLGRVGNRSLSVARVDSDRITSTLNGEEDGASTLLEIAGRNDFNSTSRRSEDGDDSDPEE